VDVTAYFNPEKTTKDKIYCKRGGFIPEFDYDPRDYGLNMLQMEDSDVNQTLTLLKVKEALSDAGISPFTKERKNIGVVLGIGGGQKASHEFYSRLNYIVVEKVLRKMGMPEDDVKAAVDKYKGNFPEWRLDSFPGFLGNVTAGRCCNVFNLDGMNCVVDAACASSLIALKVAIDELMYGDCETMVVGSTCTDNSIGMYMAFSKTPVFSTDQKVKAYDQSTKGMLIGEGSVMLVIKKLATAERDGDHIHAVIRGVASSSDGKAPGIYVPTISGQELCVRRAWRKAGLDPTTCTLVEGHGTGTPVGDKIELTGLRNVFQAAGCSTEQVAVGSIKSQIGHLKSVAGMAGLAKVVLALKHKVLPGSINVQVPPDLTDHTKLPDTCLYINTKNRPWFVDPRVGVRRAGISSFGFGGANYHAVVDEYESEHTKAYRMHELPSPCILSAATPQKLAQDCRAAAALLLQHPAKSDEAYEQFAIFRAKQHVGASQPAPANHARVGVLARDAASLAADLTQLAEAIERDAGSQAVEIKLRPDLMFRARAMDCKGKVAALFAGQGSQYVNMYEDVAMNWPEFRQAVVDMDRASTQICGVRASAFMYPRNPHQDEPELAKKQEQEISTVQNAQLSIVACSVGGYSVFERAGFKPDFCAGHSLGEYPALHAAGALSREELVELVCARAHAMQNAPQVDAEPGRMVAVVGDKAEGVRPEAEGVWLANCNSPSQIVLTGTERGIAEDSKRLQAQGFRVIPLNTGGAFHSPRMAPAERVFNQRLAAAKISPVAYDAPRTCVIVCRPSCRCRN
jgi:polyketide-type polyunsaturated fatty acid synthase PfaA